MVDSGLTSAPHDVPPPAAATLVVIGGASLDLLHFRDRSERSAGGAGLYTALAAQRVGVCVTMVGPRPHPMPQELRAADERLDWRGPVVEPDELPHFEIEYTKGGRTIYHQAIWGSEALITVSDLPRDLPQASPSGILYIVPMLDPPRQVELARHFRSAGHRVACGTYAVAVEHHSAVVRKSLAVSHIFFCNESEAIGLFGSLEGATVEPGKLLFVTRGSKGARVLQGSHATDVPPVSVEELDPTGAGDTFCGTVLALLAQGAHPVVAARRAVVAAAEMVTGVGPEMLLRPLAPVPPALARVPPPLLAPPSSPPDERVRPSAERVAQVATVLKGAPEVEGFDFSGDTFPDSGDPRTLDFFFSATLQQFGFWTSEGGRYAAPMIAILDGERRKGSDYLWAAYHRWMQRDPAGLTAAGQASLDLEALVEAHRADDGTQPLPAIELHFEQARAYGHDMTALGWTPATLVVEANSSPRPLAAFLSLLDQVGGYKEDPLRKKSTLLAVILQQRPERFLRPGTDEETPPIVDYHLQRSCLRTGLLHVTDPGLRADLAERKIVSEEHEEAVRQACFEVMLELRRITGRSMGALDWFFFQNRRRCPEMCEPNCAACPLDPICDHATELFQPVRRTTYY